MLLRRDLTHVAVGERVKGDEIGVEQIDDSPEISSFASSHPVGTTTFPIRLSVSRPASASRAARDRSLGGYAGEGSISGWLILPEERSEKLPSLPVRLQPELFLQQLPQLLIPGHDCAPESEG